MLEFFTITYLFDKLKKDINKKNKKIIEMFNNDENIYNILTKSRNIDISVLNLVAGIITLIISIFTAKLAYDCNSNKNNTFKIIDILVAFFFSGFYLTYYFIFHILLKRKC